eukprot:5501282-Alexandrium_andersonii.AAC.1
MCQACSCIVLLRGARQNLEGQSSLVGAPPAPVNHASRGRALAGHRAGSRGHSLRLSLIHI